MEHVARKSLVDTVVDQLRTEIIGGSWPIGSKIPTEARLVESLGVSRPSVREAVRSLVQLGLLETRQGDGTYVIADDETAVALRHAVNRADDGEVIAVRRALDVLAARDAAAHRRDEHLAALKAALEARSAAVREGDLEAFVHQDVAFHLEIARASGNGLLVGLYRSFEDSLRSSIAGTNWLAVADDPDGGRHRALLEAIVARDPDLAARAATSVLDDHQQQGTRAR